VTRRRLLAVPGGAISPRTDYAAGLGLPRVEASMHVSGSGRLSASGHQHSDRCCVARGKHGGPVFHSHAHMHKDRSAARHKSSIFNVLTRPAPDQLKLRPAVTDACPLQCPGHSEVCHPDTSQKCYFAQYAIVAIAIGVSAHRDANAAAAIV
jgi:hypothetical protein